MKTLFIALLMPVLAFAQVDARGPQLLAGENGGERKALGLASADIRVVIAGSIAETTMTLTFRNDTPRVLEGELTFPLPEGATISGFGLDVNGTLVDGVPVEKEKARVTYEKESRKRIDPGLVEQTAGNNFRTRVYPIPANGKRTIKVQYVSEVHDKYRLPLGWGEAVDQGSIRIEVTGNGGAAPSAAFAAGATLEFNERGGTFVSEHSFKNAKLQEDLVIALPQFQGARSLVERRLKNATVEELLGNRIDPGREDFYFVIHDTPPAIKMERTDRRPERIGVLWDASLSRLNADKSREVAVLKRLVAEMKAEGIVELVAFRNEPDAPVVFPVHEGKCEALFKVIDALAYDGGTNLGLLPIVKNPTHVPGSPHGHGDPTYFDYWLLCTDGIADLGPEMPAKLETAVYVLSNDARSNHTLLRRIASESGGAYFNLQRITDDDVINSVRQDPFVLLGVDYNKNEIADVFPRGVQPAQGKVALSGRLLAPEAKLTLKYGAGGLVMHKTEVTLKQVGAKGTGLIPRFWAEQKVADLSSDVEGNAEALSAVGREFNLVTPNTSLLVLESVEQYLQYGIVPPKNYQVVYDQFMQRIEQRKAAVAQSREQRLQQVLAMWDQRVKWWEKTYEYPKDLKVKDEPAKDRNGSDALVVTGGVSAGGARADRPAASLPGLPAPSPANAPHVPNDPRQGVALDATTSERGAAMSRDGAGALLSRSLASAAKKDGKGEPAGPVSTITIREWDPDVPYLKAMREAGGEGAYAVYLKQRPGFLASPAFYLDCADYLLHNGQKQMGVRVLTNIAELKLENAQLLRIVAHRLNQIGDRDLTIDLFEKIKKMRPEEPQSWRDLALALSDRADALREATKVTTETPYPTIERIDKDYTAALELLDHIVMNHWDRFEEIEVTALMEANRVLSCRATLPTLYKRSDILDRRLIKNLDCDLRIVLTWDADLTDVDLWVTEPSGEKCFYGHNRTIIGGLISRDFTQGYGPEEYCLRRTMPGEYKIQCNYYGSSQTSLVGPCTVQATVITNFGRPDEKRQALTVRLATPKDVVEIGKVELK